MDKGNKIKLQFEFNKHDNKETRLRLMINVLLRGGINLIIEMEKDIFNSLKDIELAKACFQPIIHMIRGEKMSIKEDIYNQLTDGQKALYAFNVYFNHASNSLEEFYWWSAYYLVQPKAWSAIKGGLEYFHADDMLNLLLKTESVIKEDSFPKDLEKFSASFDELKKTPKLLEEVKLLYDKLKKISPETLRIIGTNVRGNSAEFIKLQD